MQVRDCAEGQVGETGHFASCRRQEARRVEHIRPVPQALVPVQHVGCDNDQGPGADLMRSQIVRPFGHSAERGDGGIEPQGLFHDGPASFVKM